jgi:hypothetical protein
MSTTAAGTGAATGATGMTTTVGGAAGTTEALVVINFK